MPRYEDRYGSSTRLYVGHLSSRTRTRDLEHIFSRYGRVRDVDMKRDYAFVEFSDPRDADDARYSLDGRDVDGRRITVEFARGIPRGPGGVREYVGRGPAPGSGRCFNCGIDGHWARDCKAGDWKNKCYRCGERGHIERNCQNSPKKLSHKRERSYSRSPVRSYSPRRGRSRSRSRSRSFSRSRSYSQSRSPVRRRRDVDRKERRSITPEVERSPSPSKPTKRSPSPDNEMANRSPSMDRDAPEKRGYTPSPKIGYTPSPKESPTVGRMGNEQEGYSDGSPKGSGRDPILKDYDDGSPSTYAANGGDGGVVVDDDNNGNDDVGYPRSSESP